MDTQALAADGGNRLRTIEADVNIHLHDRHDNDDLSDVGFIRDKSRYIIRWTDNEY